jgi:hypothetical protein
MACSCASTAWTIWAGGEKDRDGSGEIEGDRGHGIRRQGAVVFCFTFEIFAVKRRGLEEIGRRRADRVVVKMMRMVLYDWRCSSNTM